MDSLLIYGFVGIVKIIGILLGFSYVGVWNKLSQEPTKLCDPNLFDRRYEPHMNTWRGNESGPIHLQDQHYSAAFTINGIIKETYIRCFAASNIH